MESTKNGVKNGVTYGAKTAVKSDVKSDVKRDVVTHEGVEPLTPLRNVIDRLFEESVVGLGRIEPWFAGRAFPLDILETAGAYIVEAALPGYTPEDIQISALESVVTIRARQTEEKSKQAEKSSAYLRRERATGEVTRIVELPMRFDAKKIVATYEHGLLTLRIPKTAQAKPTVIPIKTHASVTASSTRN
jgi:HSP20 family protein